MSYNYDYNYGGTVGSGTGVLAGVSTLPVTIVSLAIAVVGIIAMWKIFEKLGVEGWKSIIPIYNIIVLFQITDLKPWYVALALIPCVGPIILYVFTVIAYVRAAKKLGKSGTGFTVLIILFAPVALMILAFDKNCVANNGENAQPNMQPQGPAQYNPMDQQNMNFNNNVNPMQQNPVQENPMQQNPMQQGPVQQVPNTDMNQPVDPSPAAPTQGTQFINVNGQGNDQMNNGNQQ